MLNRNQNIRPNSQQLRAKFQSFKNENEKDILDPDAKNATKTAELLASCLTITRSNLSVRK